MLVDLALALPLLAFEPLVLVGGGTWFSPSWVLAAKSKGLATMLSRCLIFASCLLALPAVWGYFEGCDNTYTLQAGATYVESPYYPSNYPAGTSCRYKFTAPLDHSITVQCTINLPSVSGLPRPTLSAFWLPSHFQNNGQCTTDNFWLDSEGDLLMRGAENFCGSGTFNRESLFTELTFAYISTSSSSGRFRCQLNVQPQGCNCGWSATARISNGQNAAANEYPSMAALKDITNNLPTFCGGTIGGSKVVKGRAQSL